MTEPISVAILAAGLGTRMKSRRAKVLHEAGGLALIEHVVRAASAIAEPAGAVVVVGHQAAEVERRIQPYGVRTVAQAEQKGTGHALTVCRQTLEARGGLLVVLYGDAPLLSPDTLRRLIAAQRHSGFAGTVITTELEDPTGYGRVVRSDAEQGPVHVRAIVEQKAATPDQLAIREINSGIYCFEAARVWEFIGNIQPNPASGEIYLTDLVELLLQAGHLVQPFRIDDPSELLGINTRIELAEVDRIFRMRKARTLMLAGVTIEKPETVSIDVDVEAGQDTVIEPFVRLTGKTVIGPDCRIGMCSILQDSVLGEHVQVFPHSSIADSRLGAGAEVGPYARLRKQAQVEPGAHVGNFVELKNTRLGAGSKAMHLAYLGDSFIGKKANIGAGTITCNYDGRKKHPTTVGDGAFVGSNSTLVAPIEVGAGSYIAAGSVVTERVPQDALALGRSRQVIKEQWAKKRRDES
jgi:bifunctional UDP-N-acetylglucosamine pyrophosphorylase / glucosamine-1-phosphate N-acetyltransferase